MVSIEEAQRTILEQIARLETEKVSVFQGLNRVTPEDHIAPWDIPAADNSAMDGFAFRHAGMVDNRLKVTGFLPAGEVHENEVPNGEAIRIMTGAPVPPGCDTVVPIEDVEEIGDGIRMKAVKGVKAGTHVRKRGEDISSGDVVIPAGSLLRPQEIGMLSAMGGTSLAVYRRARVAILSTGDELLEPGSTPMPGKLINSNSYSLAAQVLDAGGDPVLLGIAADTLDLRPEDAPVPHRLEDRGTHEQLEGDHGGNRVAGEGEDGFAVQHGEGQRLPRLHVHLPEVDLAPQRLYRRLDVIAIAH